MTLHFAYPHLGVLTIDHIIPRVAGGTNRYANLVTCCFDCNNRKGNREVAEFLRELYATGVPPAGKAQQQLRWRVVRARLIREAAPEQVHLLERIACAGAH
jgi:5-methylcytosine-specific restriction endonuclease McrA